MKSDRTKWTHLALELLVLLAAVLMLLLSPGDNGYRRYQTGTLRYISARVLEVQSQELTESSLGTGQQLGVQRLLVRLSDGQEIVLDNYLTETHNILAAVGQRIVICADEPENTDPYYTVYNYDRTVPQAGLIAVFVLLLVLVGRRKGLDACLSIGFTLLLILRVILPALYSGASPTGMGLLTVLLSTAVTLGLLHGLTWHCLLGISATLLGELAACLLFASFSSLLHLTGFQTDSAEGLLLIAQNTGLQVRTLLFAGTMIASLGAVMDVAVSVLSALREISQAAVHPEGRTLFRSGMNLGQDMIGTMSNTLIFAFAGGALATMLVFYSYGVQFQQLFSSDYLTVELAQGLCSTAAVIFTVPVSAAVGALFYGKRGR